MDTLNKTNKKRETVTFAQRFFSSSIENDWRTFINVSYNILAYCLYLFFMFTIIIRIGQMCYTNGLVYAMQIFNNDKQLTLSTNKILLICYYLLNLGYTLFSIGTWPLIHDIAQMIADLSSKMGILLLLLGIIHITNMLMIVYVAYFKKIKI